MPSDGKVLRFNSVAYSGQDERLMNVVNAMPGVTSAPFSARGGRRVNNSGLALTVSSTGNGTVTVSAGAGLIYDSGYPTQGAWPFEIPTAIGPITLAARPGAGVTRVDLVIARIYDVEVLSSAVREVKIEVVPGTPTAAALPPLSLLLGTLSVPNTGTITFTSTTAVAVAAGGILPVATQAEKVALQTDGMAYPGLTVFVAQTNTVETYASGTIWVNDDSGWLDPTMGAGWTSNSGNGYRRKGGNVTINVNVSKASSPTGDLVFTMPDGFRPDRTIYVIGQVTGQPRYFLVNSDGTVRTTGAGTIGVLGSVTYPV